MEHIYLACVPLVRLLKTSHFKKSGLFAKYFRNYITIKKKWSRIAYKSRLELFYWRQMTPLFLLAEEGRFELPLQVSPH